MEQPDNNEPTPAPSDFTEKEINVARGVIKRRRTNYTKKVRKTLPLFADSLLDEYKDQDVLENAAQRRQRQTEYLNERPAKLAIERQKVREARYETLSLCKSDEEKLYIMRRVAKFKGGSKQRRWQSFGDRLRRRLEPLSETADLVLAWLEQETEPVTHWDLWRRRGDGRTPVEISKALHELVDRELLEITGSKFSETDDGFTIPAFAYRLPQIKSKLATGF